jgi:hypothetical protein
VTRPRCVLFSLCLVWNLCLAGTDSAVASEDDTQHVHTSIASIEARQSDYAALAQRIWTLAEVGYQEEHSSAALQQTLSQAGFMLEAGVAGMPTAFVARTGSGKPVIGILYQPLLGDRDPPLDYRR